MRALKILITLLWATFFLSCSEDTIDETGTGIITGTVVEAGTNEPVENVRVSTNPATSTVFTDENGQFLLEDIPEAEYSVEARKEGLLTQFEGATVISGGTVNLIFDMQTEDSMNEQPTAPQVVAPEDNATGVAVTTDLSWNSTDPDDDEITYTLEIRNDRDEKVLMYENITDTTYTVEGLDFNSKYFWQVTASDELNPEVKSSLFSFTTMDVPESRVLFTRSIGGNNVIFALDSEGIEYQLTSSSTNSFRPRKNNSSNKIAFLRTVGGQTQLFTMDPNGANQRQITSNVPVRGFNLDKVDFSWAEDGSTLLYPNFDKLYRVNANGGGTRMIHQNGNGKFITEVAASQNSEKIVLLANNSMGYDADLYTIDFQGNLQDQVFADATGAVGGLDISLRDEFILYVHDVSGYEHDSYRQLDSRIMLYELATGNTTDLSQGKPDGTNDLDPRFSPNEAEVVFVNTSNDGISQRDVYLVAIASEEEEDAGDNRTLHHENAAMPDWE